MSDIRGSLHEVGRAIHSTAVVRGDPATDRRPATTAGADMTRRVIATGLHRRGPGARPLPNDRYRAPECTLTRVRMRRVAQPKPPNRDECYDFDRCSIVLPIVVPERSHLGIPVYN